MWDYYCVKCGWKGDWYWKKMRCRVCGSDMRPDSVPGITGTRDSFGIGKEFKDNQSGKIIDNWKSWEKAGYRDALNSPTLPGRMKNAVRDKIDKINREKGKRLTVGV